MQHLKPQAIQPPGTFLEELHPCADQSQSTMTRRGFEGCVLLRVSPRVLNAAAFTCGRPCPLPGVRPASAWA
ncbi:unnamed protein product [Ixodes pacificus]